ncbi:MAG: hypothetical protein ACWA5U_04310 [bacterium]
MNTQRLYPYYSIGLLCCALSAPVSADQTLNNGATLTLNHGDIQDMNCQAVTINVGALVDVSNGGILQEVSLLTIEGTLTIGTGQMLKLNQWLNNGTVNQLTAANIQLTNDCGNAITIAGSGDTDGDGISDDLEGGTDINGDNQPDLDVDNDGIYNFLDSDSDNDDINDSVEGTNDDDNDGIPNYLDADNDDADGDGINNQTDLDNDNDGIPDSVEQATALNNGDTDQDGLLDEYDLDADGDGIFDVLEAGGNDPDQDGRIGTATITDTDNDGLHDAVDTIDNGAGATEVSNGTALPLTNSDNDALPDYQDDDDDNDGTKTRHEYPDPNQDNDISDARDLDQDNTPDYLDPDQIKPLQYRIAWDNATQRYRMYMKTDTLPTPNNTSLTAQVTFAVPHATGADRFVVDQFTSTLAGVNWQAASRVDAPVENNTVDYLSYSMSITQFDAFNWTVDQEIEVFNFANSGACLGAIHLLDNTSDPFVLANPNSAQTNPANQFTNLGWGGSNNNHYAGNYGNAAECQQAPLSLSITALLQGAYRFNDGLMTDALRANHHLPLNEPYTDSGLLTQGGGQSVAANVFAVTGNEAIVDWVIVELRDKTDSNNILTAQAALIQRDGDIVATDGVSPLTFSNMSEDLYYVAIKHRNHLGVMTANPILVNSATTLDLSSPSTLVQGGQYARYEINNTNIALLWAGDINQDQRTIAIGASNDTNLIVAHIWTDPANTDFNTNFVATGYHNTDTNLDGQTIYTGNGNDVNLLLGNTVLHGGNTTYNYNFVLEGGLYQPPVTP